MTGEVQLSLESVYEDYNLALTRIRKGDFPSAYELLEKILDKKVDNHQLFEVMKCLKFWIYRLEALVETQVGLVRAELLENYWTQFKQFVEKYSLQTGTALLAFKQGIFEKIVESYTIELEKTNYSNIDHLLKISQHLRSLKKYEKALESLNLAEQLSPREPLIKMLVADTHCLNGHSPKGLNLFRNNFFHLSHYCYQELSATMIWEVILSMRAEGFFNQEIELWLPVYVVLEGHLPLNNLIDHYPTEQLAQLPHAVEILAKRATTHTQEKWTQHLLTAKLIYSYIYVLDEISLNVLSTANKQKPQAEPHAEPHAEPQATPQENQTLTELIQEIPTLLSQLQALSPKLFTRLGNRYAHFN